jgi:phosphotransferase system IIB component
MHLTNDLTRVTIDFADEGKIPESVCKRMSGLRSEAK